MGEPVLPPMPPNDLTSIDDLLPEEDRQRLRDDLAEMARRRRRAEAECANWVLP